MEVSNNNSVVRAMQSPEYFEELLMLRAQELISQIMEQEQVSKSQLAERLGKSKAHVTGLLADGRNLTLKTLGRVCFHMGFEVTLKASKVGNQARQGYQSKYLHNIATAGEAPAVAAFWCNSYSSSSYLH